MVSVDVAVVYEGAVVFVVVVYHVFWMVNVVSLVFLVVAFVDVIFLLQLPFLLLLLVVVVVALSIEVVIVIVATVMSILGEHLLLLIPLYLFV